MKNLVTAAVASAGICFVAVLPSPTLAFRFPPLGRSHNHDALARNSRQQIAASRVVITATSPHHDNNNIGSSEDKRRLEHASMPDSPKKKSSATTDIAALVLSALLLGGIPPGGMGIANANAAARVGAMGSGPLSADTVKQAKLIADLEQRLLNMKPMEMQQTKQHSEQAATVDEAPSLTPSSSESRDSAAESLQKSRRTQPALGAGGANTNDESPTVASQSADATATSAVAPKVDDVKPANSKPFVTFHEHTFSVTVPEFNLPTVGPILLPEEGFGAPEFPRVTAAPGPFGDVLRGILQKAGDSGEVLKSIVGLAPTQADFERAVIELEQRVQDSIHTVQNPLFPSGVPLDPEFTSMFSAAKQTAAKSLSLKPSQIEPTTDLAIFMLATLPVLTVALRAADVNSRRSMPPRGQITPRIVRFPNSPAKVDREAVEEARAAAAAAVAAAASVAPTSVVPDANAETVSVETIPKKVKTIVAKEILTGVGLGRDVAAAVAADPVVLQAELTRLRSELQSATKLAEKVRALETANARLSGQVAELSRRPAPEELLRQAERREARAAVEREREDRQATLRRSVAERTFKLAAAREKLVQAFPTPDSLLALADETEGGSENTVVHEGGRETQEEKEEEGERESVWLAVDNGTSAPGTKLDAAKMEQGSRLPVQGHTINGIPTVESVHSENDREESAVKNESSPSSWLPAESLRKKVGETKSYSKEVKELNNSQIADALSVQDDMSPDEYDEVSDGFSRALDGVRGFDLDALDLEMEDLGPEDLEELRNLELEMGDLDMASLEAEFDQEDDESISNALQMAAESAMAHTSGGRRSRLRTASGMRSSPAPMPPSPPTRNSASGAISADGTATALEREVSRPRGALVKAPEEEGFNLVDLEWDGYSMMPREGEGGEEEGGGAEGEGEGQTKLAAAPRGRAAKGSGSDEGGASGAGVWGSLTASALKRKTVPELKGFLQRRGVKVEGKAKKAELVKLVSGVLQTA